MRLPLHHRYCLAEELSTARLNEGGRFWELHTVLHFFSPHTFHPPLLWDGWVVSRDHPIPPAVHDFD